jgi:hypothetical protein
MKLRAVAHSRSGDKGTIINVSLIVFDPRHYPFIVRHVTAERVKAHFAGLATGEVLRYELPRIGALNFVVHGITGGGVTRTLALDAHGKSLSSALLEMEVDEPLLADDQESVDLSRGRSTDSQEGP